MLSLTNAVGRFSYGIERTAIIMGEQSVAMKIVNEHRPVLTSAKVIDKASGAKLLKRWTDASDAIAEYIPFTVQIKTTTIPELNKISTEAKKNNLRFVRGTDATADRNIGIKIILISAFVFLLILGTLIASVMHLVKNIILIHRREIEILDQVGSTNNYVANQIGSAVFIISAKSATIGFVSSALMLMIINGLSRTTKVGLLANMALNGMDWIILLIITAAIMIITLVVTKRATLKILER